MKKIYLLGLLVLVAVGIGLQFHQDTKSTVSDIPQTNENKNLTKNTESKIVQAQKAYGKVIERTPAVHQVPTDWEEAEKIAANLRESLNKQEAEIFQDRADFSEDVYIDEEYEDDQSATIITESYEEPETVIEEHLKQNQIMEDEVASEQFSGNYFEYK